MVQMFQLQMSPRDQMMQSLGLAAGQGLAKNYVPPEQSVQRGLLEKAMANMQQGGNYEEKLAALLPTLATTPGGSEMLSTLAPLMQKQAQSQAYLDYLNQTTGGMPGAVPSTQQAQPQVRGQAQYQPQNVVVQAAQPAPGTAATHKPDYRHPGSTVSPESTYPKRTTEPEPRPLMTPEERNQRRMMYGAQSQAQGLPADPVQIENLLNQEDQQRINYNQQIQREKEQRAQDWDVMQEKAMTRAENGGLLKGAEDETVFKKFVNESRHAENPNQVYEEARDKYRQYQNAKAAITNEYDVPGQVGKLVRKLTGDYKSKEDLIKSIQKPLQYFKDHGLIPEARNLLATHLGLGVEDVERALFPPTEKERSMLNTFKPNEKFERQKQSRPPGLYFPGEEATLSPENFTSFKDKIADVVKQNPEINLISMRGQLNQEKGYGWQDINRAIVELIDEGRFNPDAIQEQELNVVKQSPVPGLTSLFQYFWKGTK